jgi:type VI secretion system secreted protein VgrG
VGRAGLGRDVPAADRPRGAGRLPRGRPGQADRHRTRVSRRQPTPYPLPAEKTKSTIKSDSSLGGGGYNELRFEDRKGGEQVFIHAERDLDIHVKHDRMENVLHDRHLRVGDTLNGGKVGDFNEQVLRDHHVRVDRHQHEHVGGDTYLRVGGIDGDGHEHVIIEANRYELVKGDENHHVVGDHKAQVNRKASLTVGESTRT